MGAVSDDSEYLTRYTSGHPWYNGRMDTVVTTREIARECGVLPGTVRQWRYRFDDFPEYLAEYGGTLVYDWDLVKTWLSEHHRDTAPKQDG